MPSANTVAESAPIETVPEETRDIQTPEGRLFAKRWHVPKATGSVAAPIVLMHDSLGCIPLWRTFPRQLALATGRDVIAYDRLGFGESDPQSGPLALDFVAREAEHVIPLVLAAFGISRFIACGHSVGGAMAVESASLLPERCEALITMGAQTFPEDLTLAGIRLAKADFAEAENLARLRKYHGEKSRWVVDAWTDTWLDPAFANWNLDSALARLSCPRLAIHGSQDPYGSVVHAGIIAGEHGVARILEGIGHVPYRENEALTLSIIKDFIADRR